MHVVIEYQLQTAGLKQHWRTPFQRHAVAGIMHFLTLRHAMTRSLASGPTLHCTAHLTQMIAREPACPVLTELVGLPPHRRTLSRMTVVMLLVCFSSVVGASGAAALSLPHFVKPLHTVWHKGTELENQVIVKLVDDHA
eukprot:scaffold48420_cov75-Phaeocystis_antarctica.AAC.1